MLAVNQLQLHKLPTATDFHWSYLSVLLQMFPTMKEIKLKYCGSTGYRLMEFFNNLKEMSEDEIVASYFF